ncbi:MAG: hypothetical protein V4520_16900 [Bacteroidota bacterium]
MGFFTPNIVVSNPIPQEVRIYYSKDFAIITIVGLSLFFGIGLSWIVASHLFLGGIVCLTALSLIVFKSRGLFNNKPQIIVNTLGLQTANTAFYKWEEILNERVSGEYTGKGARPTLEYTHPGGNVQVKVEPLNIRPQDLDILLKYYRTPWAFRGD